VLLYYLQKVSICAIFLVGEEVIKKSCQRQTHRKVGAVWRFHSYAYYELAKMPNTMDP